MSEQSPQTDHSRQEPNEPKPRGYEKTIARWTVILGISTVLLFIATGISAYFLYVTDHTLKDTLAATGRAAKATEDSVKTAADTAKRQLRAYLTVSNIKIECSNCKKKDGWETPKNVRPEPRILLTVKNSGATPAYNVQTCSGAERTEPDTFLPADFPFSCEKTCNTCPVNNIAPGAEATIILHLDLGDMMMASAGFKRLFYFGTISFTDTFGSSRKRPFCWYSQGSSGEGIDCPYHNSPNDD